MGKAVGAGGHLPWLVNRDAMDMMDMMDMMDAMDAMDVMGNEETLGILDILDHVDHVGHMEHLARRGCVARPVHLDWQVSVANPDRVMVRLDHAVRLDYRARKVRLVDRRASRAIGVSEEKRATWACVDHVDRVVRRACVGRVVKPAHPEDHLAKGETPG
jgi:hypothetical protein